MSVINIKSIRDFDLKGKTVFLRLDLNVPLKDKRVEDDYRIQEALPTIQYAREQGAKIIIASHLGRPKGKVNEEFSLEPIASYLADLLNQPITLFEELTGESNALMIRKMENGDISMLENLRFDPGEEKNDPALVSALSKEIDIYITDAFGTTHRKHASTYGLPLHIEKKGMGLLIEKELKYLDPLLTHPKRPFFLLLGGSKVSDKIKTIESLIPRLNGIAVGGAMAFAFLAAQNKEYPKDGKLPSAEDIQSAGFILNMAQKNEIPVVLPADFIESFDIGPQTIEAFKVFIASAKTVFWNGPLGFFEKEQYAEGTKELATFLAHQDCLKIVGGGDTVAAIRQFQLQDQFDHLSTGGGAVLEYLEGNGLPGIEAIKTYSNRNRSSQVLE